MSETLEKDGGGVGYVVEDEEEDIMRYKCMRGLNHGTFHFVSSFLKL